MGGSEERLMRKKVLRFALGTMFFALCATADAQDAAKLPRIGYLSSASRAFESKRAEAISLALRDLGYTKNRTSHHKSQSRQAERIYNSS